MGSGQLIPTSHQFKYGLPVLYRLTVVAMPVKLGVDFHPTHKPFTSMSRAVIWDGYSHGKCQGAALFPFISDSFSFLDTCNMKWNHLKCYETRLTNKMANLFVTYTQKRRRKTKVPAQFSSSRYLKLFSVTRQKEIVCSETGNRTPIFRGLVPHVERRIY